MTTKELRADQFKNIFQNKSITDESKNYALAFIIGVLEVKEKMEWETTPTEILDSIYSKLNTSKK